MMDLADAAFALVVRFLPTADACAAAGGVSKRWRAGVASYLSVMDVGTRGRGASREALLALASRCRAHSLEALLLHDVRATDDDVLGAFAPKLVLAGCRVDISGCSRPTTAGLELLGCGRDGGGGGGGGGSAPVLPIFDERSWRLFRPDPSLAPALVVRLQLLALSAARQVADRAAGFDKAFCFASPSNKRFTGPAQRFGQMIAAGYPEMMSFRRYRLAEVRVHGGGHDASVVLHLDGGDDDDAAEPLACFEWRLRQQQPPDLAPGGVGGVVVDEVAGDVTGCWMTDGVGRGGYVMRDARDAELDSDARGEWRDRSL